MFLLLLTLGAVLVCGYILSCLYAYLPLHTCLFFLFFELHGVIVAVTFVTYFNLQYDVFRFIRQ